MMTATMPSLHGIAPGAQNEPVKSILDTDLYKLTMQQAVLEHYKDAQVTYRFTNRSKEMRFTRECVNEIQRHVTALTELFLTETELDWLKKTCPYLKKAYLSYLTSYRFRPQDQVEITFRPEYDEYGSELQWGDLEMNVHGIWCEVILYEVPLMAIVSETYFRVVDKGWSIAGQRTLAADKAHRLVRAGIRFSEFGTRRRRSYLTQEVVLQGLVQGERYALSSDGTGKLVGTSNVHFARLFDLTPVGTVAHEWTMAIAALQGYEHANLRSLQAWDAVYSPPNFEPGSPGHDLTIALTDTFSTRVFFDDLLSSHEGREIARRWRGLRQDSGDSKHFARSAKRVYESLGIDPNQKVIIFSDSLNVDKCIDLARFSQDIGIGCSFGIGTDLTNDFRCRKMDVLPPPLEADVDDKSILQDHNGRSNALNIVVKLRSINGRNAVKISDDLTKNTGDAEEVAMCKRRFGLDEAHENVEDA